MGMEVPVDSALGRFAVLGVYFFIHFVLGFAILWLVYTRFNDLKEAVLSGRRFPERILDHPFFYAILRGKDFYMKAAIETVYLVVYVIWGSLGWDRLKELCGVFRQVNHQFWESFFLSALVLSMAMATLEFRLPIAGREGSIGVLLTLSFSLLCLARYLYLRVPPFRRGFRRFLGT